VSSNVKWGVRLNQSFSMEGMEEGGHTVLGVYRISEENIYISKKCSAVAHSCS
jgi:hypothetical protein